MRRMSIGDELLRSVYEDPDDDARRLVYADWLLERGDPRGEFIQLQFARRDGCGSRDSSERERTLLQSHWRLWTGELVPFIRGRGLSFERGFVDSCSVAAKSAVPAFREWSTCRGLDFRGDLQGEWDRRIFFVQPALRRVESVVGLSPQSCRLLAELPVASRLTTVGLRGMSRRFDAAPAAECISGFPRLRRLVLDGVAAREGTAWAVGALEAGREIVILQLGSRLTLTRTEQGNALALRLGVGTLRAVIAALSDLPMGTFAEMTLEGERVSVHRAEHELMVREIGRVAAPGAARDVLGRIRRDHRV